MIKKRGQGRNAEYFVKWQGWSSKFNSWEPLSHFEECFELIEEYETGDRQADARTSRDQSSTSTPQKSAWFPEGARYLGYLDEGEVWYV